MSKHFEKGMTPVCDKHRDDVFVPLKVAQKLERALRHAEEVLRLDFDYRPDDDGGAWEEVKQIISGRNA